jgi:hypothetical protein
MRISLILLLSSLLLLSSCGWIQERRARKEQQYLQEMRLRDEYYNKYFYFIQDDTFEKIKEDTQILAKLLEELEAEIGEVDDGLKDILWKFNFVYLSDEMEEINKEVEDLSQEQQSNIISEFDEVLRRIRRMQKNIESVNEVGFSGEDIVKFMPYASD